MKRKHFTEKENESQKLRNQQAIQDRRLIKEVYPFIEQVEIEYFIEHISVFGRIDKTGTLIFKSDHPNIFEIDCINIECTKGYFNFTSKVMMMVYANLKEYTDFIYCEGSEAPDHPYQKCGSTIKYKITIKYLK
jgi:hypothetical protein